VAPNIRKDTWIFLPLEADAFAHWLVDAQTLVIKHPKRGHVVMDYLRHYSADRIAGIVFVGSTGGILPFPPPNTRGSANLRCPRMPGTNSKRRVDLSPAC